MKLNFRCQSRQWIRLCLEWPYKKRRAMKLNFRCQSQQWIRLCLEWPYKTRRAIKLNFRCQSRRTSHSSLTLQRHPEETVFFLFVVGRMPLYSAGGTLRASLPAPSSKGRMSETSAWRFTTRVADRLVHWCVSLRHCRGVDVSRALLSTELSMMFCRPRE